jgi:mRNA interferase MazF
VARRVARGEIWLHRFAVPGKRRPVVMLSRAAAIKVIHTVIVAPITSTIRGLPSEVVLDTEQGLKGRCVANLDHIQTVRQSDLQHYISTLTPEIMSQICAALAVATGCR